jgi:chromosome segregation ATPase
MFAEDNTFTDSSISQEEREEILDEINDIVSSNKIKYDSGNYKVKAKHKGILFPITWVIISAVIIAGGILGAGLFFGARQRDQIANSRSQFEDSTSTAQAILQRAQAELEEAEAALNDINSELSNVAAELESERQAFDSRLEEEQTRLQRELAAELAAERAKLESENVSEEEIQRQLQALEEAKNAENQRQFAAFQEAQQEKLDSIQAAAGARQTELETQLREAQGERDAAQREAEARAQDLQSELANQNAQLQALEAEREAVALFETQLNGLLSRVEIEVSVQEFDNALSAIDGLDNLIAAAINNPNEAIRNIGQRQESLLGALRATLRTIKAQNDAGNDPRFELFKTLVAEADQLTDPVEQENRLRQALGTVPEIGRLYNTLTAIELNAQLAALATVNRTVENLGSTGEREAAISTLVQGLLGTLIDRPEGQAALANLNENLGALSESLSGPLNQTRSQLASTQQELDGVEEQLAALEADLERRVAAWQIERAGLENQLAGLQGNGGESEENLTEEITGYQEQIRNLEAQLAALNSDAPQETAEIAELQDQITDLEGQIAALESEKNSAEEELAALNNTVEENQALLARVASLTETQLANENTIADLEDQITALNSAKTAVETRLTELQEGLSSGENTVASEEYQNLLADYQSLQEEIEALTQASGDQGSQITDLRGQIEILQNEKSDLEAQLTELQEGVANEEYQNLLTEYQTLQAAQEGLVAEKAGLEEENLSLAAQLEALSDGSTELQEEINTLRDVLADREQSMIELSEIKGRTDRMLSIFESAKTTVFNALADPTTNNLNRAKTDLMRTFNSSEASTLFPELGQAVDGLFTAEPNDLEIDPTPFKRTAYQEVLNFAQYLLGEADNASQIRDQVEEISRREETFKKLVDSIQALSERGSIEETVSTSNYELYGTIISAYGNRIIAEPITGSQASESQFVEIRSTGLLGRGQPRFRCCDRCGPPTGDH